MGAVEETRLETRMAEGWMTSVAAMRMVEAEMRKAMGVKEDEAVEDEGGEQAGVEMQGLSERQAESKEAGDVATDSVAAEKPGSPEQLAWQG